MVLKELLNKIDELQSKIESNGKLSNDLLKKIQYKFRLDWNYHSNAMEGNSLTKEETRSVMINNITVEGKPLKDVMEIRGHDTIITTILKIGKGELRLSEKRIKEIHKGIMHEDNPEQFSKIGEWKKKENHILNYKGEKYEFVPPTDVPEEIHKLIDWFNAKYEEILSKKKNALHPAILAFEFHLRYVTIHPFYDGNGRTSRILMNLILVMFGYPPVIVKVSDKDIYNQYLADIQGYGGNSDLFYEFMSKLLVKSQELMLTAIEGGDIEESDDLDKKLVLLQRELSIVDPDNGLKKFDADTFFEIYDGWLTDLLMRAIPTVQKFNKLFNGSQHQLSLGQTRVWFSDEAPGVIIEKFKLECIKFKHHIKSQSAVLSLETRFGGLIKEGVNLLARYEIQILFRRENYTVLIYEFKEKGGNSGLNSVIKDRLLNLPMTSEEINNLTKSFGNSMFSDIDYRTKKKGMG